MIINHFYIHTKYTVDLLKVSVMTGIFYLKNFTRDLSFNNTIPLTHSKHTVQVLSNLNSKRKAVSFSPSASMFVINKLTSVMSRKIKANL